MLKLCVYSFLVASVATLTAGCASTQITNAWHDSRFSGPPLKRVMVMRVTKQAGIRRTFEDELVKALKAKRVDAVASYTYISEDGEVPKERLAEAVKEAGAQGVLVSRLVKVEKETQMYVTPYPGLYGTGYYPYPRPYYGFYGYYSWAWAGYYEPQIYSYDVFTAETNLFDTANDALIWSGTTQTYPTRNVQKDARDFANVIVKALSTSHII